MSIRLVALGGVAVHIAAISFSLDNPEAIAANLAAIMWALIVAYVAE